MILVNRMIKKPANIKSNKLHLISFENCIPIKGITNIKKVIITILITLFRNIFLKLSENLNYCKPIFFVQK